MPAYPVKDFFDILDSEGIRAVVLRWFGDLPYIAPGHDLDILIPDDAVDRVTALMSCWPEGQRVDCYSETGLQGTGYLPPSDDNIPAFPPAIASLILETAQRCDGGWWIPDPRAHALALAYHAIYLKGLASGLPPDAQTPPHAKGSHDYAAVLTELTAKVGITLAAPVTMASLDQMLAQEGWRPPPDHLRGLAARNPWIASALL
ncbi:hypothetical protein [Sulfitobacter brevis]|uniref:hypothetical protein n=1 Tax=Sulfitobacter brevis TaxID=74348 RepID=UPI001160D0AF|nr:hypothetical protein [Sulfitobacter brevis]